MAGANAAGFSINPRFALRMAPARTEPDELEKAKQLCETRRFREALGLLNRIVVREPQNATAWTMVARAHLGRGEHAEALTAARSACELAVDSEPQRLATVALVALDRHEEAFTHATEAVRLDPGDWRNYVEQARALIGMPHHTNDARSAAQTAVQLAPCDVSTHLVAGQVELADGQIEQAAEAFRRVLSIDPSNSAAFNELARMQLRGAPPKPAGESGAWRVRLRRR